MALAKKQKNGQKDGVAGGDLKPSLIYKTKTLTTTTTTTCSIRRTTTPPTN